MSSLCLGVITDALYRTRRVDYARCTELNLLDDGVDRDSGPNKLTDRRLFRGSGLAAPPDRDRELGAGVRSEEMRTETLVQ